MEKYNVLIQNIRNIISEKGYKQKAVAKRAGYNEQQFSNILNGRRTIEPLEILQIAEALDATPNDLFGVGIHLT